MANPDSQRQRDPQVPAPPSEGLVLFHRFCSSLIIILFLAGSPGMADSYVVLKGREGQLPEKNRQFIPYAFYNENTETAVAAAFIAQGYIQPQVNVVLNGFYSAVMAPTPGTVIKR